MIFLLNGIGSFFYLCDINIKLFFYDCVWGRRGIEGFFIKLKESIDFFRIFL